MIDVFVDQCPSACSIFLPMGHFLQLPNETRNLVGIASARLHDVSHDTEIGLRRCWIEELVEPFPFLHSVVPWGFVDEGGVPRFLSPCSQES